MFRSMFRPLFGGSLAGGNGGTGGRSWSLADTQTFAFYDWTQGITDAGGGSISAMADVLGDASKTITQSVGASRPQFTSNGILFDGVDDFLFNTAPFMTNSANGVIVLLAMSAPPATLGIEQTILSEASTVSVNPRLRFGKDSDTGNLGKTTQGLRNDANSNQTTYGSNTHSQDAFDNIFKLIEYDYDNKVRLFTTRINGVVGNTPIAYTASGTYTLNSFALGASVQATNTLFGGMTIKGIAILDANISLDDYQKAQSYFAHRYGLANDLPSVHPYKAYPPTTGARTADYITETFTDTNNIDLENHVNQDNVLWRRMLGGTYTNRASIINNRMVVTISAGPRLYMLDTNLGINDYEYHVTLTRIDAGTGGTGTMLYGRVRRSGTSVNGLGVRFNASNTSWRFVNYIDGAWGDGLGGVFWSDPTFENGASRNIRLVFNGSLVQAYFDGVLRLSTTAGGVLTGDTVGFEGNNATETTGIHIDSITVKPLQI